MPPLDTIERMTQEILLKLPQQAPIDIVAAATSLGIPVNKLVMPNAVVRIREQTTDTGVEVRKVLHIEYDMLNTNSMRQRFAIAHAMGHILLGHGLPENGVREETAQNFHTAVSNPEETAANNVAGALLVPKMALIYFMDEKRVTSVTDLAVIFGVSTTLVTHRLEQLGIVKMRDLER